MLSAAGATKAKKSEGVIHDGTARTPNITPSDASSTEEVMDASSSWEGLLAESRNTCTTPSGRFVDPDLVRVLGIKVASAGPNLISIQRCF